MDTVMTVYNVGKIKDYSVENNSLYAWIFTKKNWWLSA